MINVPRWRYFRSADTNSLFDLKIYQQLGYCITGIVTTPVCSMTEAYVLTLRRVSQVCHRFCQGYLSSVTGPASREVTAARTRVPQTRPKQRFPFRPARTGVPYPLAKTVYPSTPCTCYTMGGMSLVVSHMKTFLFSFSVQLP